MAHQLDARLPKDALFSVSPEAGRHIRRHRLTKEDGKQNTLFQGNTHLGLGLHLHVDIPSILRLQSASEMCATASPGQETSPSEEELLTIVSRARIHLHELQLVVGVCFLL
jgi:hypothetical protein